MRFEGTSAYVATDDLKVAVNAAITLERPLLVKGEPGIGKTVLALIRRRAGGDLHRCFGELPILHEGLRSVTVMADGELIYPTP